MGYRLADSATPIMDAFAEVTGTFGKDLIAAGSLISIGGLLVASSFITPRSGLALAENKMMPQVIARKNSKNAPYVAIIISTSISLIIALFNSTFANLALISAISRFAQYIPTIIAVFVFSKTKKTQKNYFSNSFWSCHSVTGFGCQYLVACSNQHPTTGMGPRSSGNCSTFLFFHSLS